MEGGAKQRPGAVETQRAAQRSSKGAQNKSVTPFSFKMIRLRQPC